jgi:type VI secretion system protein ImpK
MTTTEEAVSFLIIQFREFYGELITLKKQARTGTLVHPSPLAGEAGQLSEADRAANAVLERLLGVFELQAAAAGRRSTDYRGFYRQAEYVMAALADETMIHLDWAGRRIWENYLVEYRLFKTRIAGEVFFERLERLLQTPDPVYKDLATIYLLALMLGFRGKYQGTDDHGEIDRYRRQLFTFIFHGQPELSKETKRLFPEAYLHTVEEGPGRKVPQIKGWVMLLAVLVAGYLLVSNFLWSSLTTNVLGITDRIDTLSR